MGYTRNFSCWYVVYLPQGLGSTGRFLGGIATFTPRAIAEDPEGVEMLIAKLDEHPLWACYVLPSVVAMVANVANSGGGPNSRLRM